MQKLYRYIFGSAVYDEARPQLIVADVAVRIAPRQRKILSILLDNPTRVVTRAELLSRAWDLENTNIENEDHALTAAIDRLRKALGPEGNSIKTVHGAGYRFDRVPTREEAGHEPDSSLALTAGMSVPRRSAFKLQELLGSSDGVEVWLAKHHAGTELRVYKFASTRDKLRELKREARVATFIKKELGQRSDLIQLISTGFDESPYFLELEYGGENLLTWSKPAGRLDILSEQQRIDLFLDLAKTLSDLHALPLIHADIKPQNILVAPTDDGRWHLRLVDFGSSRLQRADMLEELHAMDMSMAAVGGALADPTRGTFMYMAPEIWQGATANIRSDVFSLGVVLYQLIVGDLTRRPDSGWQREISDPMIRADIERAVDGDPDRRFGSIAELALSLRNRQARAAAAEATRAQELEAQRLRALLERQRARRPWLIAALISLSMGLALSLSMFAIAHQAQRAAEFQASRAEAINRFLNEDVLAASDPGAPGQILNPSLHDVLSSAAAKLDQSTGIDTETQASLQATIGHTYLGLSDYKNAEPHLRKVIELAPPGGPAAEVRANALYDLVQILLYNGRREEAMTRLNDADRELIGNSAAQDRLRIVSEIRHGDFAYDESNFDEALVRYNNADRIRMRVAPKDDRLLFMVRTSLSDTYYFRREYPQAERVALDLMQPIYSIDRVGVVSWARARNSYASALVAQDRIGEAEAIAREVLRVVREKLGPDHFQTGFVENELANILTSQDQFKEGAVLEDDVYRIFKIAIGPDGVNTRLAQANLGITLIGNQSTDQALHHLREAEQALTKIDGANSPAVQMTRFYLAQALNSKGNHHEALNLANSLDPKQLDAAGESWGHWPSRIKGLKGLIALGLGDKSKIGRAHV